MCCLSLPANFPHCLSVLPFLASLHYVFPGAVCKYTLHSVVCCRVSDWTTYTHTPGETFGCWVRSLVVVVSSCPHKETLDPVTPACACLLSEDGLWPQRRSYQASLGIERGSAAITAVGPGGWWTQWLGWVRIATQTRLPK